MSFIGSAKQPGCFFCAGAAGGPSRQSLVLAVTRHALVMLNRYPYNNGHLLVAPRRHAAELDRLSPPARAALAEVLRRSIGIVRKALRPEGLNVGLNLGTVAGAGVLDHLHWHVVPRWGGDTNFMPVVAEAKVMPQHLEESWDALRPRFAALDAPKRGR
jgi:ATP adenylyltransferase